MLCNQFRNLMFERLDGELSREQERECSEHEQSCAICRAEQAQFKWVAARLRAGWPAEDPQPVSVVLPQRAASPAMHNWFDLASLWFSRASAALVMACLVALLLVRPTIEMERGVVHVAFGRGASHRPVAAEQALTQEQVKAMVQAAVNQEMTQLRPAAASVMEKSSSEKASPAKSSDGAPQVTQVAYQVRQLQQSQASLWQTVQQHHLYLESLWRSSDNLRPASLSR